MCMPLILQSPYLKAAVGEVVDLNIHSASQV